MHVVRRISAVYQAPSSVGRFDKPRSDYAGYTPGDVQVRQPPPPPPPPVVPRTPATSTTPTATPAQACASLWTALLSQSPAYMQACLADPTHRSAYDKICLLLASNQISPATGAAQWAAYVSRMCPPPPPPVAPPPPPTSTPTVPTEPPPFDVPGGGPTPGGDSGGAPDQPGEEAGYLRQVGSIVGIGLILAVGLTYARKRGMLKLTKRRRRR